MSRYKLIIQYDGTAFFGWQRQKNPRTVQGELEKVLTKIFKKKIPPVLYGGSVDDNSVKNFKEIEQIDGFLIGGASKSSKKFIDIIKNYYR